MMLESIAQSKALSDETENEQRGFLHNVGPTDRG
jgi:hypothetical protein